MGWAGTSLYPEYSTDTESTSDPGLSTLYPHSSEIEHNESNVLGKSVEDTDAADSRLVPPASKRPRKQGDEEL